MDRPETFQIIDCLDELVNTRECFHRDLLSRSICVAACLPEISHDARLQCVQTGPASLAPERVPKAGSKVNVVRVAPRTTEVKQQQDWRLVFVDRPETFKIIDCLDEICCPGASAQLGACPWLATRCVCERSRPDQNWAWRAWLSTLLKMEVSSDSECSLCPGDDKTCRCFHEGRKELYRK